MYQTIIEFVSLFFTGILAGEEFVVRYGVHITCLLIFILITLIGTVPINKGVLTWRSDAPPSNCWDLIIEN